MPTPPSWTAIVLAGGRSERLGYDKAGATIAGSSLIHRVVDGLPNDVACILVGPDPGKLPRPVRVTLEDPPGGGPVAGIAAGLALVDTDVVGLIAVDMPFAGPVLTDLVARLRAAPASVSGVQGRDQTGRVQPLAAAYRTKDLRQAVLGLGQPSGRSVRQLVASLAVETTDVTTPLALLDIDTPEDLAAARRSVPSGERGKVAMEDRTMDDWVTAVTSALGIDQAVDVDLILDVARDAAHGVARPAAPVTTFLLGCAVGAGMSPEYAAEQLTALAKEWPAAE